jgi:hypothetical protein
MCFFGGSYLTLIAAVEAYKMVGYESSLLCISNLMEDFKKVVAANKKDDEVDADGFYFFWLFNLNFNFTYVVISTACVDNTKIINI